MAIPKFLRTFVDTAKTIAMTKKTVPGPPGSGQQRVKEGEITKRKESREGLFGSKPFVTRQRLRKELKRMPSAIPGGGKYTMKERLALEKELFPESEYGQYIAPYEVNRRIRLLKKELYRERTGLGKIKKRRQIRFLESLRGKKEDEQ